MFIPDGAKSDVIKFFSSQIWQTVLLAWKQRTPPSPSFNQECHTIACEYSYREGFLKAIEVLGVLPFESANPEIPSAAVDIEKKLLDPRD